MNIALIAHEKKKELMIQFCIAYAGVLSKHNLWSASALGNIITENVGLKVNKMLTGAGGVEDQIASRVSCGEIDIVLFFRDPLTSKEVDPNEADIIRLCDVHSIPIATNIATAEMLIHGLERGDLEWRNLMH